MAEQHGRHPHNTKKKCAGECGQNLPLAAFGVNKQAKDGLHYYCKLCNNLRQKKWNKDNPNAMRDAKRRYLQKTKARNSEMQQEFAPA